MAKTVAELRAQLSDIEPSPRTYRGLTAEDVPALVELSQDEEAWLAARAVFALSTIESSTAHSAIIEAAHADRPEVRIAASRAAARTTPAVSDRVLTELLTDPDAGVRKSAVNAASGSNSGAVLNQLEKVAMADLVEPLRLRAADRLSRIRPD